MSPGLTKTWVGREQQHMNVRMKLGVAAASVAALALSACGSSSLSGEPGGGGSAPSVSVSQNVDLASKLPESIKSAGVIKIGTDPTYAPSEFLAGDGKTVQGFDVDLFNQVAAKFGVKTEWQPSKFGSIITGVNGKKYDMGISSFTINPERMQQVDMVKYFNAGTQWATQKGNPKGVDPENACGKNIAVQTGTVQETDDLAARQKKCGSNKINVLSYDSQAQATSAVVTGKADAMLSDSPVVAYAVLQTGGKLEALGDIYDAAPYGYVLPKGETEFGQAIVEALKQLEQEGAYKAALEKWGVQQGAISDFTVNPTS
jgi:polar amino acid transport system substrate-binding protein